jgi:hypothetical protein
MFIPEQTARGARAVIISASRRTDIPSFYSEWFMNRIREGYCLVPNPFNRNQVSRVSLEPGEVDGIVFWTRNPRPLFSHFTELEDRGYRFYFLYTLMANPRLIDPGSPALEASIETFRELSARIGPQRIIWRYDPILLTSITDRDFHMQSYRRIASALQGCTQRSVISIVQMYRKIQSRIRKLTELGIEILPSDACALSRLLHSLAGAASENGMHIQSCANELHPYGIELGKCVDEALFERPGHDLEIGKDIAQREHCRCVASKDIGMYDSCLFGCIYCYATTNFDRARANYRMHDPASPSLLS